MTLLREEDYEDYGNEPNCRHCGRTRQIVNKQDGSVEECPYCRLDDEEGD